MTRYMKGIELKLFDVTFEYTEKAQVPNVVANTADEAVAGTEKLVGKKVKDARNFAAVEQDDSKDNFSTSTLQ